MSAPRSLPSTIGDLAVATAQGLHTPCGNGSVVWRCCGAVEPVVPFCDT